MESGQQGAEGDVENGTPCRFVAYNDNGHVIIGYIDDGKQRDDRPGYALQKWFDSKVEDEQSAAAHFLAIFDEMEWSQTRPPIRNDKKLRPEQKLDLGHGNKLQMWALRRKGKLNVRIYGFLARHNQKRLFVLAYAVRHKGEQELKRHEHQKIGNAVERVWAQLQQALPGVNYEND